MLTDRENRPALAVTLSAHALMMACLAPLAPGRPIAGAGVALVAMIAVLLFFVTVIGGIAWLVEVPIIRRLNDADSTLKQLLCCVLFLLGIAAIVLTIGATWTPMPAWGFVGMAFLSGFGAYRQFRRCARDDRPAPAPLPAARLVR